MKAISKVFRRNFVFHVETKDEASELLAKLNIDLVLVDLDACSVDLAAFTQKHPRAIVWGLSQDPYRINVRINPERNRIFEKSDFASQMIAELKTIKRERQRPAKPARERQQKAGSDDFNFVKLVMN